MSEKLRNRLLFIQLAYDHHIPDTVIASTLGLKLKTFHRWCKQHHHLLETPIPIYSNDLKIATLIIRSKFDISWDASSSIINAHEFYKKQGDNITLFGVGMSEDTPMYLLPQIKFDAAQFRRNI